MMIQFNLLPDVKKEYIKAKRTKRMILSISLLTSVVAIGIVAVFFSIVQFGQKKYINDLTADIKSETASIQSIPDVNTMLTVQNQLALLPNLHASKNETSRLFDYLSQLIPPQAPVSNLTMDIPTTSMTLTGQADSLATINKLIDTFKSVEYRVDDATEGTPAFTITSSRLSGDNTSASYQISMTFDKTIFDNTKKITLVVKNPDQVEPVPAAGGGR